MTVKKIGPFEIDTAKIAIVRTDQSRLWSWTVAVFTLLIIGALVVLRIDIQEAQEARAVLDEWQSDGLAVVTGLGLVLILFAHMALSERGHIVRVTRSDASEISFKGLSASTANVLAHSLRRWKGGHRLDVSDLDSGAFGGIFATPVCYGVISVPIGSAQFWLAQAAGGLLSIGILFVAFSVQTFVQSEVYSVARFEAYSGQSAALVLIAGVSLSVWWALRRFYQHVYMVYWSGERLAGVSKPFLRTVIGAKTSIVELSE